MLDQSPWFSGNNCVRRHILGHNDLAPVDISDAPTTAAINAQLDERDNAFASQACMLSRPSFKAGCFRHLRDVIRCHRLKAAHRRSHFGQDVIPANSYATVCCLVKFRSREFEPREFRPRKTLLHPYLH